MTEHASSHTPGPWQVQGRYINGAAIIGANGVRVGTISHTADKPIYQKEADARLIAAAPDLLNGCKALLGLLHLVAGRPDISNELHECLTQGHRIEEARDAIRKAEGL